MKSQPSASSQPPPSAKPLTAAMTGNGASSSARPAVPGVAKALASAGSSRHLGDVGAGDERLVAGAGQDRARAVGVSAPPALDQRSEARESTLRFSALSLSGRLIVIVATAPACSTSKSRKLGIAKAPP